MTDSIFDNVHAVNAWADSEPETLRIRMDTKATVHVGEYSRGGLERSWNGYLLDSVQTVLERAGNFVWRTHRTAVSLLDKVYAKGITLRSTEKKMLEKRLPRSDALPWWDVIIKPQMVF